MNKESVYVCERGASKEEKGGERMNDNTESGYGKERERD